MNCSFCRHFLEVILLSSFISFFLLLFLKFILTVLETLTVIQSGDLLVLENKLLK